MNEYISREAMLKNLTADLEHHSGEGSLTAALVMKRFIKYVEDFPAADVQPAKHGRWITSHPVDAAKEFKCTACGGLIELPVFAKRCYYDYCPNCGARMDGDSE